MSGVTTAFLVISQSREPLKGTASIGHIDIYIMYIYIYSHAWNRLIDAVVKKKGGGEQVFDDIIYLLCKETANGAVGPVN